MDKNQIDKETQREKEEADIKGIAARQLLADLESEKIRIDAEAEIAQIQNDAQK